MQTSLLAEEHPQSENSQQNADTSTWRQCQIYRIEQTTPYRENKGYHSMNITATRGEDRCSGRVSVSDIMIVLRFESRRAELRHLYCVSLTYCETGLLECLGSL